jgi:hypothetical protein
MSRTSRTSPPPLPLDEAVTQARAALRDAVAARDAAQYEVDVLVALVLELEARLTDVNSTAEEEA